MGGSRGGAGAIAAGAERNGAAASLTLAAEVPAVPVDAAGRWKAAKKTAPDRARTPIAPAATVQRRDDEGSPSGVLSVS